MARSSRISSGSTSRVPLGIGWIIRSGSLRGSGQRGLLGDALDRGAQLAQALVDALVAAVDLADVADLGPALGAQRREHDRHARPDVRGLDPRAAQAARPVYERAMRVGDEDVGAHRDELVAEEQARLEHPLVDEDLALAL